MWKVSYLDLSDDKIKLKGNFSNDKQAIEWLEEQEENEKIIALKLLVWSDYFQNYTEVLDFRK